MTRFQALEHIRIAGFHHDNATAMRVYVENRVSYEAYRHAWDTGRRQREAHDELCKKPLQRGAAS